MKNGNSSQQHAHRRRGQRGRSKATLDFGEIEHYIDSDALGTPQACREGRARECVSDRRANGAGGVIMATTKKFRDQNLNRANHYNWLVNQRHFNRTPPDPTPRPVPNRFDRAIGVSHKVGRTVISHRLSEPCALCKRETEKKEDER
jgi:hypothetical protein